MVETIRAFIAVELTDEVKQALASLEHAMQRQVSSGVRWVSAEAMHLTLKFLGEVPLTQVEAVAEAMREASRGIGPFQVDLHTVGAFPNARSPRVLWVDLRGELESLVRLAQALEHALAPLGLPPEGRPFSPHLTLARVRDGVSAAERQRLAALLQQPPPVHPAAMRVEAISLIRSVLRPQGPEYTRLREVKFTKDL